MRFYALIDPRDGAIRYVGRTVSALNIRLNSHIRTSVKGKSNSPKAQWIRELVSVGLSPVIRLLEEVDVENGAEIETKWIKKLRRKGCDLLNVAKPLDCVNKSHSAGWTEHYLALLGKIPDDELALLVGVTRKAVAYQRYKRNMAPCGNRPEKKIPPPNMAGWNRMDLPPDIVTVLGKYPDYVLAEKAGVSKCVIARKRRALGIKSYAQQTGRDGKFTVGMPHPRWARKLNYE